MKPASMAAIFGAFRPREVVAPVAWIEANLDLAADPTSEAIGAPDIRGLTPYLVEPLQWWGGKGRRKGTFVAVEQIGKSSTWKWGLMYTLATARCLALIVYESDEKAEDENTDSLEPLMRAVPQLDGLLSAPGARRKDHYRLGQSIVQFGGAGSEIASTRCNIVIGDEVELWRGYSTRVDNVRNLDKRGRTFADFKRYLVSSPQEEAGLIWREFCEGSQGYWHLRCLGCGELTMRSCDIGGRRDGDKFKGGLQFEIAEFDGAKRAKPETLRLSCPACGHEHTEDKKAAMNTGGAYVHRFPERRAEHESWQAGALASQFPGLTWADIAAAQLRAGATGSYGDRKVFFNSFRGLPLTAKDLSDGGGELKNMDALIQAHGVELPEAGRIVCRALSADTQGDRFYWIVRGFDPAGNSWLLDNGVTETAEGLFVEAWAREYEGARCNIGIVDTGGHRARELYPYILRTPGVYGYKGNPRIEARWKPSAATSKLVIANPLALQGELLYAVHTQLNREKSPFWGLPFAVDPDYQKQLLNVRPVEGRRDGHQFDRWRGTGNDHYFDCEKMAILARDLWIQVQRQSNSIPARIARERELARARRESAGRQEAR